jgi:hypothetical protein
MLDNEDLIVLSKAAAWIADRTGGRRPNISTLHRWATRGVRGIKLETVAVGHVRYTSIEAVRRFLNAKPQEPAALAEVIVAPGRAVVCRDRPASQAGELQARVFRGRRLSHQEPST